MHGMHQTLATIPNRYVFINQVEQFAVRHSHFSLMLVDVVRFSDVTTSLGICTGDKVLLQIANRIINLFGDEVGVGRMSGDVFGLLLPGQTDQKKARDSYERLSEHFKAPIQYDEHAFIADFNVGVVQGQHSDFEVAFFISRAEAALKQAKENRYENFYYMPGTEPALNGRRLALKADLRRAISNNELELYYQPKVDLTTLTIVGAECLLRWNHPLDGVVFPGPLIEAAESYHMMNELAYWTLKQAFHDLTVMCLHRLDIKISINMSPTQLYDSKLISHIRTLCAQSGLNPSCFEFELTEDVALSNSLMVKEQLSALRAMGVEIAIDDFGKGYSNLAYIRDLNINALKIDKSFVMELSDNPVNRAIIQAAKVIGDAKHCDVVAEGIEQVSQLHVLRELGIQTGQGYLFSRAIPLAEFIEFSQQDIMIGSSPLRRQLR
ncbi:putative bifunctional diguanylate cyclase/phosphodiesterase [Salinimonas lutimaris]|uniref:putative bifunctional diguanylate cyclase/phosphodiesterase n=1 Tax=Salinimonas lutimaris TaxID=914153 RepID=UPI0010C0E71B|nr:bifunctional diguanylate cyclase/phosphodiesterase [Salinimonas lutimaris]